MITKNPKSDVFQGLSESIERDEERLFSFAKGIVFWVVLPVLIVPAVGVTAVLFALAYWIVK